MGRYAAIAEQHYRKWLPEAYAEIKDRAAFFQVLEDEAHSQVEDLEDSFCGPDPDEETFVVRLARFKWARFMAEEIVFRDFLLPEPEVTDANREESRQEAETDRELASALTEFQRLLGELRDQQTH